jgi:hypothetical protein
MKDISGHRTGSLLRFRPVLRKWIDVNRRYCQVSSWKDIPWGYNERASLSIFAAACWLSGCIALEEFSELKESNASRRTKKRSTRGRCDLYVAFKKRAYILEAKVVWPSLASSNWRQRILSKLDEAREDARRTHAPSGENKLGLLIVAPTVPRNKTSRSEELIQRFAEFMYRREEICSAWVFPKKVRKFSWTGEKERMHPARRS